MIREKYWEVTKENWFRTAFLLFMFLTVLGISSFIFLPRYWYFWLLMVVATLAMLVEWHAKNFAYRCPRCDKVFEISALEDILGPNGVNKKYLKCPICRRKSWAEILRIKEQPVLGTKLLFEEQNNTGHEKGKG
jgi:hypothetical protein